MFPIRDEIQSKIVPVLTYLLIGINTAIFVYLITLSPRATENFINTYAFVPGRVLKGEALYTVVTGLFIHASFGHLFSNMLFLNVFGSSLESSLGRLLYLGLFFLSGIFGFVVQLAFSPLSIPNLGSSGAVAGLMGAYLVAFPRKKVAVLVFLFFFVRVVTVPAFTILFLWFIWQVTLAALSVGSLSGIAYFAHVGGFIFGALFSLLYRIDRPRTDPDRSEYPQES